MLIYIYLCIYIYVCVERVLYSDLMCGIAHSIDKQQGRAKRKTKLSRKDTTHSITSVYVPQANALVECINHTIQIAILECIVDQQDLMKCLDSVIFQFRVLNR